MSRSALLNREWDPVAHTGGGQPAATSCRKPFFSASRPRMVDQPLDLAGTNMMITMITGASTIICCGVQPSPARPRMHAAYHGHRWVGLSPRPGRGRALSLISVAPLHVSDGVSALGQEPEMAPSRALYGPVVCRGREPRNVDSSGVSNRDLCKQLGRGAIEIVTRDRPVHRDRRRLAHTGYLSCSVTLRKAPS